MLDLICITLLVTLAALLCWAAREVVRSIRRRQIAHTPLPYELLVAREGTIRVEGGGVYLRLNFDGLDDRDESRARVVAGATPLWGRRVGTRPQVSSPINRKEVKRQKDNHVR